MRFIHTSDLHIGKTVNGFSMLEEQKRALDHMVTYVEGRQVNAVLLSGDLYDRSVPPAAAVAVLDDFLTRLVDMGVMVFAIAGNHDCGERIGFANRILEKKGLFMEGTLSDPVQFVDRKDEWGTVRIHMIPFAKPAQVRALYHSENEIRDFQDSMNEILRHVEYGTDRNILLTHQFVVNQGREPELSDSETRVSVGGTDQVEAASFSNFDYVALGHIHGSQKIGGGEVYYSGSPVKYSFSEISHKKSVIYGEIKGDGTVEIEKLPLVSIHDMRKIRGRLSDLIDQKVAEAADPEDYILAVLTDQEELIDPIGTLRSVYPNVMQLQWEKKSGEAGETSAWGRDRKEKEPFRLFADFYQQVTGKVMTEEQEEVMKRTVEFAKEESS